MGLKSDTRNCIVGLPITDSTGFKITAGNVWSKIVLMYTNAAIILRNEYNPDYNLEEILKINYKWCKNCSVLQIVLTEKDQPTTLCDSIHMPIVTEESVYSAIQRLLRNCIKDNSMCISPTTAPNDINDIY